MANVLDCRLSHSGIRILGQIGGEILGVGQLGNSCRSDVAARLRVVDVRQQVVVSNPFYGG
jgi:hypothetical protein